MIWVSEWSRWVWESWTFRQNTLWHVSCNHRRLCDVYFSLFVSWWCKRANDTKRNIRKPDSSWLALICQRQPWHFVCNRNVDFEWALRSFRASTRFYSRKISIIDEWVGNRKQFLFSTMCELFIAASRLCMLCGDEPLGFNSLTQKLASHMISKRDFDAIFLFGSLELSKLWLWYKKRFRFVWWAIAILFRFTSRRRCLVTI